MREEYVVQGIRGEAKIKERAFLGIETRGVSV